MKNLKLVVPVLTKFDNDGNLILDESYKNFIEHLIENGVDVLMPCGTNSEFHVMDTEERMKVVEFIFDNFKDKVEIMPHVGSSSLKETLKLADHAFKLGAEMVSIVAPYYLRYDEEAIVNYYSSIASSFPEKKFVLYNIPMATGNPLTFEIIVKIKEKSENIIGMKDTDSRPWIVAKLKEALGDDFIIYGGNDMTVFHYLSMGADGHVSGTANVFPKLLRELLDSFSKNDFKKVQSIQTILNKVVENISGHKAFIGANKYVLKKFGFDLGIPRSPSRELTENEKTELDVFIEKVKEWAIL